MQLQKKIYQCNSHYLSTIIVVKGREVRITFNNGGFYSGTETRGMYATLNPDIQLAIENDPRFGKSIILFNAVDVKGNLPEIVKSDVPQPIMKEPSTRTAVTETAVDNVQPGVHSKQLSLADVKAILTAEPYNIPLSRLKNKQQILDEAKSAGIDAATIL